MENEKLTECVNCGCLWCFGQCKMEKQPFTVRFIDKNGSTMLKYIWFDVNIDNANVQALIQKSHFSSMAECEIKITPGANL